MENTQTKTPKIQLSSIPYYLLILTIIILILNAISARSDAAYNLIRFRTYTILSGSMEPKYDPGDLVVTIKSNPQNLQKGDVITFTNQNQIITHRIKEKTKEGYITQGDNNNVQDSAIITPDNIIGKVAFSIPKAGFVIQFLSQTWVVTIEMILLGIFIIIYNKDE